VGLLAEWRGTREREVRSLFDRHYAALCRVAFVMLRDASAAEETVMDAFLRTFAGWRRVGSMDRPDLYLRRAVVNACNSRLRRTQVEARAAKQLPRMDAVAFAEPALVEDGVWDAVCSLPPRQRACIVLRYYEDRSEGDIATILDCSVGTVKSQLAKARQKLKAALDSSAAER
jgi:RNA polymerase sigma-70 factor (sigma-E family)